MGRALTASARAARREVLRAGLRRPAWGWLGQHRTPGARCGPRRRALPGEEGSAKPQGGQRQGRYVARSHGRMGGGRGVAGEQNSVRVSLETYSTTGRSLLLLCTSFFPQMLGYKNISIVPFFILFVPLLIRAI